jgi:hypothetical protein
MSEDVPPYGATKGNADMPTLSLIDVTPEDDGRTWVVKLGLSADVDSLADDWWKIVITVIVARIADESMEALTGRARAAARGVLGGLSKSGHGQKAVQR